MPAQGVAENFSCSRDIDLEHASNHCHQALLLEFEKLHLLKLQLLK
jgi:hypothetical protein